MNIRNIRQLKQTAACRLEQAPQAGRIVLIYGGITLAMSALVTVANYLLGLEIAQTGGLRNIGIRSVLSSLQTFLPIAQSLIAMALQLGYCNAALRIGREQYASPNSLRMGFDRFWSVLRCNILVGCTLMGGMFLSVYLAIQIFFLTPLSHTATDIIMSTVGGLDPTTALENMMLDEIAYNAFLQSILPVFPILALVCFVLLAPIFYQYRMVSYVIIDNPGMGALAVLRQSRMLMRRNRFALFRLDVSLWWYYLLGVLASAVGYGDLLLPMVGITFPWPDTVGYFLFYGLYLVMQLVIFYFFLNRVSVTYALAYESLLPEKEETNAVVLGNIFEM